VWALDLAQHVLLLELGVLVIGLLLLLQQLVAARRAYNIMMLLQMVVVVVVVVVSVPHQFPAIAASPAAVVLHRRVRSSFVFSTQAPTRTSVRSGLPFRPLGPLRQPGRLDDRGRTPTPWLNCASRTELGTVRANDGNTNWELPRNKTASQNNKLHTSNIVILLLLLLLLLV
jgi:hypothetical protein